MSALKRIQTLWERTFHSSNDYYNHPGFSYYAFISYTEKDEKWAEWLQWNLEHYKIPTKVRNENRELPKRVRPVFWYKNDLAGAHLSGAIKKELEQSQYMIVVCSPTSARKEWVNDEVRYFKDDLGRGDKIIPFIVEGKINAENPEQECLPLPIRRLPREKEQRCIDVREYGKNKALVNIVSTLFNVRFDVLWDRFRREKRRRIAVCGVFVALFAAVLFGCWDYFLHTKYEYFVDLEDCNGMPTGIMQISNDEANEHYRLYRFEYRRRQLQRVVYVDGDGNPQEHTNTEFVERPCIQELSYNDGELTSINCKNSSQKTLYIMHLSKDKLAADLKDENENQAANFIFSATSVDQGESLLQNSSLLDRLFKSPSKIARYIYERDADGYITRKTFARHNGDNDDISMDANGISGFEYERDSLHRVVRIHFLDNSGAYKANHIGVAGKKYQYDEFGNLVVAEYVDKNGKLKYNEHHWAKCVEKFDSNGYNTEERVYGADGKPCVSAHGYHRTHAEYHGNSTTIALYDIHDKPAYSLQFGENPGGFSKMTAVMDAKGRMVEMQFKDSSGKLCFNQHHEAVLTIDYNRDGLVSAIRSYDTDRKPCINMDGYHCMRNSYNEQGELTEQSLYNVNDEPTQSALGIYRTSIKYDNTGLRVTEIHTYNMANVPAPSPLLNGAAWIKLGYHGSSRWVYDISFYTNDNKPLETVTGAKICCERDPYGQITAYKYYDAEGELSSTANHCAVMKLSYNDMGMVTERSYYDENEKPTTDASGTFRQSVAYNNTGRVEKICCYDTQQHLKIGSSGWAMQQFSYDNGAVSAQSFYGENEEPIEINGVHKIVYDVDDCGYILSQSAYGKEMQPSIDSQISAHKIVNLYDDNKRTVGKDYYDIIDTLPFVKIRCQLNERGLVTKQTAYDAHGRLVESPLNYGVAKVETRYDSQDRITYICTTDHNAKKMNSIYGFAEQYVSYEKNIQEVLFLDSEKKLVNNAGWAEPCAYNVSYVTDTGQPLYSKLFRLSLDNEVDSVCDALCYDFSNRQVIKAMRLEDVVVHVFDISTGEKADYYLFEDEYNKYKHVVDSVQDLVESKYGLPKLYHYVKQ